jgi:hypothetical protein
MNKGLIIVIVVVVVIILGVGWYFMQTPAVVEQENITATPKEIALFLDEQNNSGMNGTATLIQTEAGVKVVVNFGGAITGVIQPAHIHLNNCENIGGVKYPLNFPMNGYSETVIDTTLAEILGSLPLSINIHKSVAEASTYVACGNIIR